MEKATVTGSDLAMATGSDSATVTGSDSAKDLVMATEMVTEMVTAKRLVSAMDSENLQALDCYLGSAGRWA